ncbi:MAG: hypothetical protein GQ559_11665 [Desulfobulbaceae bacterium]|nr:hypothetical protein [Desulfobulbaceae bacterium]
MESYKDAKERAINDFTRGYVTRLLEETGGNVSRAAEASGLTRAALQKIMRRYDIVSQGCREQGAWFQECYRGALRHCITHICRVWVLYPTPAQEQLSPFLNYTLPAAGSCRRLKAPPRH